MDQLNINDTMSIINYGVNIQNMMSELSACAFDTVKGIDLKGVGSALTELLDFFKSDKTTKTSYLENENYIDNIVDRLKNHRVELLKDCEMLEQFCVINREYIKEIIKLIEHAREVEEKMKEEKLTSDEKLRLGTLEKRIRELEMSQTVAYSFEPQIKVVQENESQMAEKIQSALVNALALWKRQQITSENKESVVDANELIMKGINELIELQREGYSLVDKS